MGVYDGPLREDMDVPLDARRQLGGGGGGLVEGRHEVLGQVDVLEHALKLVGQLYYCGIVCSWKVGICKAYLRYGGL